MKSIILCVMVMVSIVSMGQEKTSPIRQKMYRAAYETLCGFYQESNLCVSDSIYDLNWGYFANEVDDETKKVFSNYRIDRCFLLTPPFYSDDISAVIDSVGIDCQKSMYIAEFSCPYREMIMCYILPIDKRIGIFGAPQIQIFLFKFDLEGNILDVSKKELCID